MTEKTFLVKMDEPIICNDCKLLSAYDDGEFCCQLTGKYVYWDDETEEILKPEWCPLVPVRETEGCQDAERSITNGKKVWVEE